VFTVCYFQSIFESVATALCMELCGEWKELWDLDDRQYMVMKQKDTRMLYFQ